jgi:hypothetical protein
MLSKTAPFDSSIALQMKCIRTHLPKHCRTQRLSILLTALNLFRLEGGVGFKLVSPD